MVCEWEVRLGQGFATGSETASRCGAAEISANISARHHALSRPEMAEIHVRIAGSSLGCSLNMYTYTRGSRHDTMRRDIGTSFGRMPRVCLGRISPCSLPS